MQAVPFSKSYNNAPSGVENSHIFAIIIEASFPQWESFDGWRPLSHWSWSRPAFSLWLHESPLPDAWSARPAVILVLFPLYLCYLFLLPSPSLPTSLFLSYSLFRTHFYLFGSFRRHKCLLFPYKRDVLQEPRGGCVLLPVSESIMFVVSAFLPVFSFSLLQPFFHIYSQSVSSFSQSGWRETTAQVNLFCLGKKKKKQQSGQRCEHTDPAMLNLTAARRHIPDTSDDNFTTAFWPPLQRRDRLTFTTRFWLELTWVRTGPRGKTTEWGPE